MNKPQLPDFIQDKIDHFIENFIAINKNGKHLVLGKHASNEDIILQSNDYLSLANHPLIKAHLAKSLLEEHQSLFMSAIFLQSDYDKPPIESRLAKFTGFKECLLSQSGWCANVVFYRQFANRIPMYISISLLTCHCGREHVMRMQKYTLLCITTAIIYAH